MTRRKSKGAEWTTEALAERHTIIRRFEIDLPDLLPKANWPRTPRPNAEPNESDLLFESLFLLASWPPPGMSGVPPEFPLALLGEPPPEDDDARQFVDALLWAIEPGGGSAHIDLLAGWPEVGIMGFHDFRRELGRNSLSLLTEYRVCLAARYAIRQLDSTVFTLDLIASLKRQHSGAGARKTYGFDRLARTAQWVEEFKKLWDLEPEASHEAYASSPRSGTELDTHGLPDDMLWVSPSIRRLALAVLAIRTEDLDPELARRRKEVAFDRMREEYGDQTAGHFEPGDAQTRDPEVVAIIRSLDATLAEELQRPAERAEFMARFLDALYPKGYRSRRNPLGPRSPSSAWIPGDVRRVAQLGPRATRVDEARAKEIFQAVDSDR